MGQQVILRKIERLEHAIQSLQERRELRLSDEAALAQLRMSKPMSELAGSWKMSDKEAGELLAGIKKGWSSR